jgi:2-haloacid dehalogenase
VKPAAVVFDLFGTLLDISSIRAAVAPLTSDPDGFVATWRDKQIAYSFAGAIMGLHEDFDTLTAHALRFAAAKHGVPLDTAGARRLESAWRNVAAHADAVPALQRLRERDVRCAVLTNGTPQTAAAATAAAGIAGLLDVTLSVEAAGVYKPASRVYALATAHYGVPAGRLLFVTSNGWDATGAAVFGMRVAWCNRSGVPAETFGPPPARTIRSLNEVVALATEESPP